MTRMVRCVITGATGALGSFVVENCAGVLEPALTLGRKRPSGSSDHLFVDFLKAAEVGRVEEDLSKVCSRVDRVLLFAGVDSRLSASCEDPSSFQNILQVNCVAQTKCLAAVLRSTREKVVRVVIASSDVVGAPQDRTFAYAASKSALEEAVLHFPRDFPSLEMSLLVLRLPFLGVGMNEMIPASTHRDPVGSLDRGIVARCGEVITEFLKCSESRGVLVVRL